MNLDVPQIERKYDIDVREVSKLPDGTNELYRIETSSGSRILKVSQEEPSLPFSLLTDLGEQGFPAVSPERTADGQWVTRLADGFGLLFPYCGGRHFDGSERCIRAAGRTLARFHDLSPQRESIDPKHLILLQEWLPRVESALADADELPFSRSKIRTFHEAADTAVERLGPGSYRREDYVVVHGDYHGRNLLFDDGEVTSVLDWENAEPGVCHRDVSKGLNTFGIPPDGGHALSPSRVAIFLESYRQTRPFPLSAEEIHASMVAEALSSIVWGIERTEGDDVYEFVAVSFAEKVQSLKRSQQEFLSALSATDSTDTTPEN